MNKSGQRFGEYQLINEVGHGGKSIVYRAFQSQLGRHVALKVLIRRDQTSLLKFQQEGTITANFNHPGIRKVFTADSTPDGTHYIVMEYVDLSLRQILQKAGGRPMRVSDAAPIVTQLAEVLDYIHGRGWVHLDIKPSNVLRFEEGRVVLSDFGIARRIGQVEQHGTPQYMSPEQVLERPAAPISDVYSLGVVLYEMLAGRPPFQGENELAVMNQHRSEPPPPPRKFNRRLPSAVEKVILKALAKDPRQRYQSAGAMAAELQKAAKEGKGISKAITTTIDGMRRLSWQVKAGLASVMLLLLTVVVAFIVWPPSSVTPTPTPTLTATATQEAKATPSLTAPVTQTAVTDTPTLTETSPAPTVTLGSTRTPTWTPTPGTTTPTPLPSGWRGEYHNNPHLSGSAVVVRTDPQVNFEWGIGSPAPGIGIDGFSVSWTRNLELEGGTWRFYARSDDGIRVWVDDRLVISEWHDASSPTLYWQDTQLQTGSHSVRVEYYDNRENATAKVWWERRGP